MPMLADLVDVVIGVDTHTDTHTAVLVAVATRAVLAEVAVSTDPDGYDQLLALAGRHGTTRGWAIEGAGGYGAGLTRHLHDRGELVIEIDRPQRPTRRGGAKTDRIDAERAARDALSRTQLAAPKTGSARGALAALQLARRSAVEAGADTTKQLLALIITAPEPVRARFRDDPTTEVKIRRAARLRLRAGESADIELATTITVLTTLARRIHTLRAEATAHHTAITAIIRSWRPDLLDLPGVGPITAAEVLTAWSHPGRIRSEAAFAMLAGAAPIPASSGKTVRHRLNHGGNRQLNRALHVIARTRLRHDDTTRAYADRRRAENKTDREILRCLKRAIARQLFRQLEHRPVTA